MKQFTKVDAEGLPVGTVQVAYLDGYPVGDRVLEGVMFAIVINPDNTLEASIAPGGEDYFATLSAEYWLPKIAEFAAENDLFASTPDGTTQDDVVLEDPAAPTRADASFRRAPIVVQAVQAKLGHE